MIAIHGPTCLDANERFGQIQMLQVKLQCKHPNTTRILPKRGRKIYDENSKNLDPFRNVNGKPKFDDPNDEETWRKIYYDDKHGSFLGECVSICKYFTGIPGPISSWKPGDRVWGNETDIPPGTVVGAFPDEKQFSGHAGIYTGVHGTDSKRGDWIEVYDQFAPNRAGKCPQVRKLYREGNHHNGGENSFSVKR